jgi:4-amino-4-deoxy-L-arabinose transferase-like glycosyltransferase
VNWPRLAAFAVPATVYVASASWEPASWDTAELQGVPYILGIAHPTGFPFYVLVGYVWSHAAAVGTVAFRMNAMSGIAIAIASLAAYEVARTLGAGRIVALLATFWFAFTQNVWAHAARAEAQDLATACAAVALYAFLRWMRTGDSRWFAGAFALCGLGMAAHPNVLWLLPAFLLGAVFAARRPSLRLAAASVALTLAGLALYLYLPLRSAYVVAHGLDPTAELAGAGGGIFWNYNDPRTLPGLALELSGAQFQTPSYFVAAFNPMRAGDALWAFVTGIQSQYGTFATLLLFGGFIAAWRRDWQATLVLCAACIAPLFFSVVYPNEGDVGRYRMLASWLAVPLLGALTPQSRSTQARLLHAALILFLASGVATAFLAQRGFLQHAPHEGGRWVIDAVGATVPAKSVVVTGWLDATSLAYGAYVDGSLPGLVIVSDNELRMPVYRQWARRNRVFVLADPHDVTHLAGARYYMKLDSYHELFLVTP